MGLIRSYKELEIWKQGMQMAVKIYAITNEFPPEEKFGLVSQMRRCVVSIPSNIAEGSGRSTYKDFVHFLNMAYGSLCELETQIILAKRLNFTSNDFAESIEKLKKQTNSYIKYLKTKQ